MSTRSTRPTAERELPPLPMREALHRMRVLERRFSHVTRERNQKRRKLLARMQPARNAFFSALGAELQRALRLRHDRLSLPAPKRLRPTLAQMGDPIDPPLLAGSLVQLYFPPYAYEWTFPQSPNGPWAWTHALRSLGNMGAGVRVLEYPHSHEAFAGIGIGLWSNGVGQIEFTALVDYEAQWWLASAGDLSADCDGWIGLYVTDGVSDLIDQRQPLWWRSYSSFFLDEVDDRLAGVSALSCKFPVVPNRHYLMWVVCGVRADASGQVSFMSGSAAQALLRPVRLPFMSTVFHGQVAIPPGINRLRHVRAR